MTRQVRYSMQHPQISRRTAVQAGAIGLLGMGMNHLAGLQAADPASKARSRSVIYIFLSGGLGQHDSFDMKPEAPEEIRGEFLPIATRTPGVQICEHLPQLAARSHLWSLVRSLTHPHNEHSDGHMVMLSGRTLLPPRFDRAKPQPSDWPSIASIVSDRIRSRNNLPSAVVLPERLIHRTGRVIPGQFGGQMGPTRDPWFIEASPFNAVTYGAYPEFEFSHSEGRKTNAAMKFQAPSLELPHELTDDRLARRLDVLSHLEKERRFLDTAASTQDFDRYRQSAVSLLTSRNVRQAFDVASADDRTQERYGRNSFGWSLLMARRLVEAGTSLVQVNLGNNEAWDTHGNAFPNLRDNLYPPMDRAVSALLDDLHESGLLKTTMVVMAGEFGRTPKTSTLARVYNGPGRDHWGGVQTVLFAGGGIEPGVVIGSSDKMGAYPASDPQTPETFAATIYHALGIPQTDHWSDAASRPHFVYQADPIAGLLS